MNKYFKFHRILFSWLYTSILTFLTKNSFVSPTCVSGDAAAIRNEIKWYQRNTIKRANTMDNLKEWTREYEGKKVPPEKDACSDRTMGRKSRPICNQMMKWRDRNWIRRAPTPFHPPWAAAPSSKRKRKAELRSKRGKLLPLAMISASSQCSMWWSRSRSLFRFMSSILSAVLCNASLIHF